MSPGRTSPRALPRWAVITLLVLILIVAAGYRLYGIGEVPPGHHFDEASITFDAFDLLAGRHTVFSERPYGREMFFVYVAAPFVKLLGPTRLAVRLPTALVGILTVLATYLLTRELLVDEDRRKGQVTALLAALFLGLSFWHLAINRLGFRANYLPLTETLCFLFFWRAVRTDRLRDYVLSGLFLGLGLNTYISARFVPIVLVAFFAMLLPTREGRALIVQRWRRWAVLAAVALLVFAPLLIYFLLNPDSFLERARGVSIFSPHPQQGDFWGLVIRSVLGNAGTFGFRGDESWIYNIPGRPGLPPVQAALFWAGIVLCLVRWRRPRYLFLPVWWLVILLPSILAPDPIPHHLRAFGTLPVASILSALSFAELASLISRRPARLRRIALPVILVLLLSYLGWTAYDTWHSYFDDWLQRDEVYYAYHGHIADLAEQMNQDEDPEAVYIFPVNYDRLGGAYEEYTLELLHDGRVPFRYITVDDASVAQDLTDIAAGKSHIRVIVWTHGEHVDADPRQVLSFFLERFGQQSEEKTFRGYRIITYELPSSAVDFREVLAFTGKQAVFAGKLELSAEAHSPAVPSGEALWVALRWKAGPGLDRDYKASLRLYDQQGHLAGQSDVVLLSNDHRATSQWQPGEGVTSYHLVESTPGTIPDNYQLSLTVYDPDTQQPLRATGDSAPPTGDVVTLGSVEVDKPLCQRDLRPEVDLDPVYLAQDLQLVGYALDRDTFAPGETIDLGLYWRAMADIGRDYDVSLRLASSDGEGVAEWVQQVPYPTSQWQVGDRWRIWHALRIPPEVDPGQYHLEVGLSGPEPATAGALVPVEQISIQGRPRLFELPAIQHPMFAQLGEGVHFLGYDLEDDGVRPGETLHLTLYWQAADDSAVSYTVFTHLLDANSQLWGQQDSIPGQGSLPTTGWLSGEVVVDEYEIEIDAGAPQGEYVIEIGMYQAETGERLPVFDGAGRNVGDYLALDSRVKVEP